MSFRPDAHGLLEIVRETFVESVLPALPADKRHAGLMIANALGIALREVAAGDAALHADVAELKTLLEASTDASVASTQATPVGRAALERELARRIREGAFDEGAAAHAVHAHLVRSLDRAVAIDQPKSRAATVDVPAGGR